LRGAGGGLYEQVLATDASAVLRQGVALGAATWRDFLTELGWTPATPARVVTHQVGRAHQEEILRVLEIDRAKDFVTYPFLGNTGSAALPTTLSIAAERGVLKRGDKLALLGIGSGLACLMMGVEW
jgi:3-oxoacyl-[acyl-carrier-protein] synthase-3